MIETKRPSTAASNYRSAGTEACPSFRARRHSVRRGRIGRSLRLCLGLLLFCSALSGLRASSLDEDFRNPPEEAKPWVYWIWINGNVSKEAIRADLEDMKRVGIGGAMLFEGSLYLPVGPVRYGSPAWHEHVRYALEVADELGLRIAIMNCAGWATSGGPWNDVERSMKRLVWSESSVEGGKSWQGALPKPAAKLGFYRDVAVLALPDDSAAEAPLRLRLEGLIGREEALSDRVSATAVAFAEGVRQSVVTVEYAQAFARRLLTFELSARETEESIEGVRAQGDLLPGGEIFASDDGAVFRPLAIFSPREQADALPVELSFPETKARFFRVVFERSSSASRTLPSLAELRFSQARRIGRLAEKSGLKPEPAAPECLDSGTASTTTHVFDLSDRLAADGSLAWDPPPGKWTLLRFGYTTTGTTNHPSPPEGEGFEADKLDDQAVARHLDRALGGVLRDAGPHAGRSLAGVLCDSWEAGAQNWTARMPELFRERRHYPLLRFLPTLAGRIVDGDAASEAFLADYRKTLGELYAEKTFGTFAAFAAKSGMKLFAEAYGGVFDEARILEQVDFPMVEFWNHGLYKGFDNATSAGHLLGRRQIMAEAFTSRPPHAQWTEHPRLLKGLGDAAFAEGINTLVLHSYVLQPRADLPPGFTHGRYGTQFGRLNSWWPLAPAWIDYLRRCQFLLQQGQPVADVLELQPSRLQSECRIIRTPLVPGYKSDLLPESFLNRLSVRDGSFVAQGGSRYRLLVLPEVWTADCDTLRELERLTRAGGAVVGKAPARPAGLTDLIERRKEWQNLVERLWTRKAGVPAPIRDVDPRAALSELPPDFRCTTPGADIRFFHRKTEDADIYFVSNQTGRTEIAERDYRYCEADKHAGRETIAALEFRVDGRRPELWDPLTGRILPAPVFQTKGKTVRLSLRLDEADSVFVVFRKPLPKVWIEAVGKNASDLPPCSLASLPQTGGMPVETSGAYELRSSDGTVRRLTVARNAETLRVEGPWRLTFEGLRRNPAPRRMSCLVSLSELKDDELRFFSGRIRYSASISVPEPLAAAGLKTFVALGEVRDLARIRINGKEIATLWKPPYVAELVDALRAGPNEIEVEVATTWVNRLIGDERFPLDAEYETKGNARGALRSFPSWWNLRDDAGKRTRESFHTWKFFEANSPLLRSGLVGPVTIRFVPTLPLREK